MGAGCVVDHKLDHILKLTALVRQTLHDVLNEHTHNFLRFVMSPFDQALFHGPPWGTETATQADQGGVLKHERILQLRATIAAEKRGDCAAA